MDMKMWLTFTCLKIKLTSLPSFIILCWMYSAGKRHPDRSLAATAANCPLACLFLFYSGVSDYPNFPFGGSVELFFCFLYDETATHNKKAGLWKSGASHWQLDGCHKWQAFVLIKYAEVQALQRQKAEARQNNLFQLGELTMALSELVTFPCLFCLGGLSCC